MLPLILMAMASLQLSSDPKPLAPDEARLLTPNALADVLIGPVHPPVASVSVGSEGMEAPTPPGPTSTRLTLYFTGKPSDELGFCEETIATVYLKMAAQSADGKVAASVPDSLSSRTAYRWIGTQAPESDCQVIHWRYFLPEEGHEQSALLAVRRLVDAQRRAKKSGAPRFQITLKDKEGPTLRDYAREHPDQNASDIEIVTDGRAALSSLPISELKWIGPADRAFANLLLPEDRLAEKQSYTAYVGGDWTVTTVSEHGLTVAVRMLKAIPAPF